MAITYTTIALYGTFKNHASLFARLLLVGDHKIHTTYTSETYCNYKTALIILAKSSEYSLFYYLSLLNSSFISWVFL